MSNEGANDLFAALAREESLVDRVSGQMESLIVSGKLQPGESIPPESRLARLFGVSRTVIREALSRLEARHLLRAENGSLVVSAPTAETVGRSMSLMLRLRQERPDHTHVLEVRRMLEGEIAQLAAARRTADDLQWLGGILADAEALQGDPIRFPALDVAFHRGLAIATHNELFVVLIDALADTLITFRRVGYQVPGMPLRSLTHHRAIYDQVAAGSPEGARAAMLNHMLEAEQTVREAQAAATEPAGGEPDSAGRSDDPLKGREE